MMFIQQGLMRALYSHVEQHRLTRGFVNFEDQGVNRQLVEEASVHQGLATLDLKDASDRVRVDLVASLFPSNWVEALLACRTEYIKLPDGRRIGPVRKFAPMGSAVCFPIEALVFWSLLVAHLNVDVYVYGDDIIIPQHLFQDAVTTLESFDLRVNTEKSCHDTPFRESCGAEFFAGFDVGYVKLRHLVCDTVQSEVSTVEFVNNITDSYGDQVSRALRSIVDGLYGPHFVTPARIPLCFQGDPEASNDVFFASRWNRDLHIVEYLLPCIQNRNSKPRKNTHYSWGELLRLECERAEGPSKEDPFGMHEGTRSGIYAVPCSTIKYRWKEGVSPYQD